MKIIIFIVIFSVLLFACSKENEELPSGLRAGGFKLADSESKAIAVQIDNQTYQIDRLENEAENLKKIAAETTSAVKVQTELSTELSGLLEDSEILIDTVN